MQMDATEKSDSWAGSLAGTIRELSQHPPKRWKVDQLQDFLTLEYGENLPSQERADGEVPVYGSSGQVGSHSAAAVEEAGVIVGRKGSIGDIRFSEGEFWPIDTTYYVKRSDTELNLRFLGNLLDALQLDRLNAASAIPGLNRSDVYNLRVTVPPLEEQRRIASVLYAVNKCIEANTDLLAQVERVEDAIARRVFEEGVIDHSNYSSGHHRSRLKRYPESWSFISAGEFMDISRGAHPRPKSDASLWGGRIPIVKIGDRDRGDGRIIRRTADCVTEKGAKASKFVPEGTLVVSNAGTCGAARIVGIGACVHDHWLILEGYEDIVDKGYLYHYINYNRPFLSALASGSTVDDLNTDDFGLFDVAVPSKEEQVLIADILDSWHDYTFVLQRVIECYRKVKEGLMQDLLSGQVRVQDRDVGVVREVARYG